MRRCAGFTAKICGFFCSRKALSGYNRNISGKLRRVAQTDGADGAADAGDADGADGAGDASDVDDADGGIDADGMSDVDDTGGADRANGADDAADAGT